MRDNSFEKQIADKLNNIEVQPSDGLLNSIFEKRAARPKRFAGIGFTGMALAVLVTSVAAISLMLWQNENPVETAVLANSEPSNSINATERNVQESTESTENSKAEGSMSENVKQTEARPTVDRVKSSPVIKATEKNNARTRSVREIVSNGKKEPSQNALAKESTFSMDNYFNADAKPRPEITYEKHTGNSHLYVYQSIADDDFAKYNMLYSRNTKIEKLPVIYDPEEVEKVNAPELVKDKSDLSRRPLFVDLMYTPSMNIHSSKNNSELDAVNNAMTKASYNSQYGVRVSVPVASKFSVFSGLFYRNQSNAFKGSLNYQTDETRINTTVSYINDPVTGAVIAVTTYDTVNYKGGKTQQIDYKNTYKLFQVPVGISYNFGYKKFDFAVHASALVNVFRNSQGYALNLEQHQTNAFSSKQTYLGVGAGVSWMAAYKIAPQFRLILEPGFQYFGINSMKAGNNTKEKAFNTQLSIGLRYTVF